MAIQILFYFILFIPPLHPAPTLGAASFPRLSFCRQASKYLAHSHTEVKSCVLAYQALCHAQKHPQEEEEEEEEATSQGGEGACPGTARRAKNQQPAAANKSRWTYLCTASWVT